LSVPKGYDIAVAINTMGSKRRMSLALGVDDYEAIAQEIDALTQARTAADGAAGCWASCAPCPK
jgi:3-polyprenyl-4-hydroxybenzoate decarboxylase